MKLSNTEKNVLIVILTIILTVLLSNLVYTQYLNKEGFFGAIIRFFTKVFKFLAMIGDFFCWLGDVVAWVGATVAAIMYYVANVFQGCLLFYLFDMFVGTMWYLLFIVVSFNKEWQKYFTEGSGTLNNFRLTADGYFYGIFGEHVFTYSDATKEKCYKLKFEPFPKWPF